MNGNPVPLPPPSPPAPAFNAYDAVRAKSAYDEERTVIEDVWSLLT